MHWKNIVQTALLFYCLCVFMTDFVISNYIYYPSGPPPPQYKQKIVIIGAGIAGLSAAYRLEKHGFTNYVILEATDRIGGRIMTKEFGDGLIELGAQEINGMYENVAYSYAESRNLLDYGRSYSYGIQSMDEYRTNKNDTAYDSLFISDIVNFLENLLDNIDEDLLSEKGDMRVDAYLEKILKQLVNEYSYLFPRDKHLQESLLRWFDHYICVDEGCNSLSEMSLKSISQFKDIDYDNTFTLRQGMMSLIDSIAANIRNESMKLRKPVQRIAAYSDGKSDNSNSNSSAVTVTDTDGQSYEADHVIVTLPLGVLKEGAASMFEPELSDIKMQAIEKMGFGTVDNIFLEFEQPFWPVNNYGLNLLWTTSDNNDTETWSESIIGFYTVPTAPNVLVGWVSSAAAQQMESMTDDEVRDTCVDILKQFTKLQDRLPKIKAFTRSKWYSNEFSKGSYSYLTADLPDREDANVVLSEPVYIARNSRRYPAVLFAGEATHPYYFATIHGAMASGIREANRIQKFYTKN